MKRTLIGLVLIAMMTSASQAHPPRPSHAKGTVVHSFGSVTGRLRNAQAQIAPTYDWKSQVSPYEYDEALSPPAGH